MAIDLWKDIQRHVGVNPDGVPGDATAAAIAKALGVTPALPSHIMHDMELFYKGVRKVTGKLDDEQVAVINTILSRATHWSIGWLAYALGTSWHESRLKIIEEYGKGAGKAYGKVNATGKAPYGRGLPQITWDANYKTIDKALGLNGRLANDYDVALERDVSVNALIVGMERGLFTGKSLSSYIKSEGGTYDEFVQARRIINGTDRSALVASYAEQFKESLIFGGWG